jgi:26S proteasome regulatory subunit T3
MESLAKTATPFTHVHNDEEKDLYFRMQELERELELLTMQEEFLKDEQRHLKSEYIRSKEEVSR